MMILTGEINVCIISSSQFYVHTKYLTQYTTIDHSGALGDLHTSNIPLVKMVYLGSLISIMECSVIAWKCLSMLIYRSL